MDFWEGTYLTQNIVEAMRRTGAGRIVYASGSGVYGDRGDAAMAEDQGSLHPSSPYGASKLAGEALISAYCSMFGIVGRVYRFANVVGPRQTHGVAYDFVRRLLGDPERLEIKGDGLQSKSYVHVEDILAAIAWTIGRTSEPFDVWNVATGDYVTVTEIAHLALEVLGLSPERVELTYTGGRGGWKGDVPVVRFDLTKINATGWKAARTSREALLDAMRGIRTNASRDDAVARGAA